MKYGVHNPEHFGKVLHQVRKSQGLTQQELALTANTAARFISDLENGKPTCQIGKALHVAHCLGLQLELHGGES